jgi:hypothetical protein
MSDDEIQILRDQIKSDRKLIQKAADTLAEIDRNEGLSDIHADVLAALRIRLEGKKRASLDELITVAGDISGKRDLGDVLGGADEKKNTDWPEVEEKKLDWPGS